MGKVGELSGEMSLQKKTTKWRHGPVKEGTKRWRVII
jgi:hypothetical protein